MLAAVSLYALALTAGLCLYWILRGGPAAPQRKALLQVTQTPGSPKPAKNDDDVAPSTTTATSSTNSPNLSGTTAIRPPRSPRRAQVHHTAQTVRVVTPDGATTLASSSTGPTGVPVVPPKRSKPRSPRRPHRPPPPLPESRRSVIQISSNEEVARLPASHSSPNLSGWVSDADQSPDTEVATISLGQSTLVYPKNTYMASRKPYFRQGFGGNYHRQQNAVDVTVQVDKTESTVESWEQQHNIRQHAPTVIFHSSKVQPRIAETSPEPLRNGSVPKLEIGRENQPAQTPEKAGGSENEVSNGTSNYSENVPKKESHKMLIENGTCKPVILNGSLTTARCTPPSGHAPDRKTSGSDQSTAAVNDQNANPCAGNTRLSPESSSMSSTTEAKINGRALLTTSSQPLPTLDQGGGLLQELLEHCAGDALLLRPIFGGTNQKNLKDFLEGLLDIDDQATRNIQAPLNSLPINTLRNTLDSNGLSLEIKREEVMSALETQASRLRAKSEAVRAELRQAEQHARELAERFGRVATGPDQDRFTRHLQESERMISLLLSVSGRLARTHNSLDSLGSEGPQDRRHSLEAKREKLAEQLGDARRLKEHMDRRAAQIGEMVRSYLGEAELQKYEAFLQARAQLLLQARELEEAAAQAEEQTTALRTSLHLQLWRDRHFS